MQGYRDPGRLLARGGEADRMHPGPFTGGPAVAFALESGGGPHHVAAVVAGQYLVRPGGGHRWGKDGDQAVRGGRAAPVRPHRDEAPVRGLGGDHALLTWPRVETNW